MFAFACVPLDSAVQEKEKPVSYSITLPSTATIVKAASNEIPVRFSGWDGTDMTCTVADLSILRADVSTFGDKIFAVGLKIGTTDISLSYKTAKATVRVTVVDKNYL